MLYHSTLAGGMDLSKSLILLKIQINTRVSSAVVQKHDILSLCKANLGVQSEWLLSDVWRKGPVMVIAYLCFSLRSVREK